MILRILFLASVFLMMGSTVGLGADPKLPDGKAQNHGKSDVAKARADVNSFWNVSAILKVATRNIGQRYNLNADQQQFTDDMMTTRVTQFLEDHQNDIWPLIRDLVYYQQKAEFPESEEARRLGPVALKIISEAKEEILRSNTEWREILSEDQKRVHDYDLKEMDKTFKLMESNFEQWAAGTPKKNEIFPPARPLKNEPPRPAKPETELPTARLAKGDKTTNDKATSSEAEDVDKLDNQFDAYVDNFIRRFGLNPTQKETAFSILREIKERAAAFRVANKDAIEASKAALASAKDPAERREVRARHSELIKPLNTLFVELKDRLDSIPDEAQRERQNDAGAQGTAQGAISGTKDDRSSTAGKKPAAANSPKGKPQEEGR